VKWWPAPNQVRSRLCRLQEALAGKGIALHLESRGPGHARPRLTTIIQPRQETPSADH
jgi:hypothetical protein